MHDHLVLEFVVLLGFHLDHLPTLLELCFDGLGLLCLLPLAQINGLLDLLFLILPLLLNDVVILTAHLLRLDVELQVDNLLLDFLLIALLKTGDLVGAFLSLLNLLPSLHLFLFEESDTVSKQLGISFDSI